MVPPALLISLLLFLAMRARGAPLTKIDGKYQDGTKTIQHSLVGNLVDKTMTMCEFYLIKTHLEIAGRSKFL